MVADVSGDWENSVGGAGDPVRFAAQGSDVPDPVPLLTRQQPVDDLPLDQWGEHARVSRGVEEPDQAHDGVQ